MPTCLIAIDQGTTSSRAIVFDTALTPLATAQQEFTQHFPGDGEVEHDPEEIWQSVVATVRAAMAQAGVTAGDVAAIGITNQRETAVIWDRATGKPIHNAIVWQDRRTASACAALRAAGHEPGITQKTGLLLDPYFSATKIAWLLDHVAGARAAAEAGRLAFGTIDTFLARDRCHQCGAHAPPRHPHRGLGPGARRALSRAARAAARGARLRGGVRHHRSVRGIDPHSRRCRRPAGRDGRAGLFRARHDEVDLRHRMLRAAQHGQPDGDLAQPAAHHHRVPAGGPAHLRARRRDLRRRRDGAMAARRPQTDPQRGRDGRARGRGRSDRAGLSGAGLRRPRRAASRARPSLRARRSKRSATRRAT